MAASASLVGGQALSRLSSLASPCPFCPDQLALDIDRDAEDQNRYLDGMDSDFMSVTGLLTGSVKRFSTMARSGRDNRKLLCGMALGLVVLFFILSYLLSRART